MIVYRVVNVASRQRARVLYLVRKGDSEYRWLWRFRSGGNDLITPVDINPWVTPYLAPAALDPVPVAAAGRAMVYVPSQVTPGIFAPRKLGFVKPFGVRLPGPWPRP